MKISRDLLPAKSDTGALVRSFLVIAMLSVAMPAHAATTSCLECHEPQPGRGGAPVKAWRDSIHAENGISCNGCHGGDPKDAVNAMNPERGFLGTPGETDIPAFCGRCHIGIKADYLTSAHGKALGKGGPTCVTCHGSHGIKRASLDLINETSCTRCHSYDRAAKIKGAMQEIDGSIGSLDLKIQQLRKVGIDTDDFEKKLFSTRNQYHRLFHDVDTVKVIGESGRIKKELDLLNGSLASLDRSLQQRKMAGLGVVAISLLAALLFYLLRRSYR